MKFQSMKDGGSELWFSNEDIELIKKDKKLHFDAKQYRHILNNFVKIYVDYEASIRAQEEEKKIEQFGHLDIYK